MLPLTQHHLDVCTGCTTILLPKAMQNRNKQICKQPFRYCTCSVANAPWFYPVPTEYVCQGYANGLEDELTMRMGMMGK